MQKVFIRSPYNYDTDEASNASGTGNFPETKTQQQFKDACDINRIVAQYAKGVMPIGNDAEPLLNLEEGFYGVTDFQTAMNAVRRGQEAFNALPSATRAHFQNDAQKFVDFVTNPDNIEAVRDLGLAPGKPYPEAVPTPQTTPSPTP
jgi:hypothetical protein